MSDTLFYKRSTFVAHLPVDHRYTASHAWLAAVPGTTNTWRVGLTKFAYRMLGELVEVRFDVPPGQSIAVGDVLGNIEGFKALSDLFGVVAGTFRGGNPTLTESLDALARDVHGVWLYEAEGAPAAGHLDVTGYVAVLDATIDRLLAKQQAEAEAEAPST